MKQIYNIVAVSEFGFLTKESDTWFKCDRSILKSELFLTLKRGMMVEGITYNEDRFVTSFIVLNTKDSKKEVANSSLISNRSHAENSETLPPSFDSIRYAQCVNLSFDNARSKGVRFEWSEGVWTKERIKEAFDVADLIYEEFNRRVRR